VCFREKYLHGLSVLQGLGFEVVEGALTRAASAQGYRSGTPRARADELMELFDDASIEAIFTTIGGSNSSSLIPHLDFDLIRQNPKIFCGYSDVTSLHLAILARTGLSTFYGPAVVPSFGEWPTILPETLASLLAALRITEVAQRELSAPAEYSRHVRNARTDAWRTEPRRFEPNPGPRTVFPGTVEAPALIANLNTLVTAAGTDYFPELDGRVLVIEEMNAALSEEERDLRHLQLLGVFERIAALVIGKPEAYSQEDAPFDYEDLVREIVQERAGVPVVMDFDCGHTMPMLTLAQETRLRVEAPQHERPRLYLCEAMVT
jgi:muramoyltetrapeptide carboxypeptidase LdcA involved in peptidoglycan recycling